MFHLLQRTKPTHLLSGGAALAALLVSSSAFAQATDAEPCGGIELTAISECHFELDGGCEAKCEPLSFVAACDGQCDLDVQASCDTSCTASCEADCQADPGRFDCRAACTSDCQANARARCDSTDSECIAYFEAECSASCEAECDVVAPSASCEAQCQSCCTGSCDVDANFECQLDCTAELQGGCEYDCRQPEGALFCDGQYIAVQDLPACLQYLYENFEINVEAEASAEANISCAAAPNGFTDGSALYMMMAGLGLAAARLRRRRRQ
jgi:uncharacterized protein (TIGR03382 family)